MRKSPCGHQVLVSDMWRQRDCGLTRPISVASRFERMLDLPQHPHKGSAEADNNGQKQQCQSRRRERGNIHCMIGEIKKPLGAFG